MVRKLHAFEELYNGSRMCELACSFVNEREYNPHKSRIRIAKIEAKSINNPILDCDGACCAKDSSSGNIPPCVERCPTGALCFVEFDKAIKMREEIKKKRSLQPIFKLIGPWTYPLPWRPLEEK